MGVVKNSPKACQQLGFPIPVGCSLMALVLLLVSLTGLGQWLINLFV